MTTVLWILQIVTALLYGASGVMKVFMFESASKGVQSFAALPRQAWMGLGVVELVSVVGLIVPVAFHCHPALTGVAATILALESLVFVWVHARYRETASIIMSSVLGLVMAIIACERLLLV
jgi:hypothetical protein